MRQIERASASTQQALLTQMSELLDRDSCNYSVFLRTYEISAPVRLSAEHLIKRMLGQKVQIESLADATLADIESTLHDCLAFRGYPGAGPSAQVLASREFALVLSEICRVVGAAAESSEAIQHVDFYRGHPGYPVFWGFAFLFRGPRTCVLFAGSASD